MSRKLTSLEMETKAALFRMRMGVPDDYDLDVYDLLTRMKYLGEVSDFRFVGPTELGSNDAKRPENTTEILISEGVRKQPQGRQKFTVAHEIAHVVSGHQFDRNRRIGGAKQFGRQIEADEREANSLAAMILMPARLLYPLRDRRIEEVARIFGVSLRVAELRMAELKREWLDFGDRIIEDFGQRIIDEYEETKKKREATFDTGDYEAAFGEMMKNSRRWNG